MPARAHQCAIHRAPLCLATVRAGWGRRPWRLHGPALRPHWGVHLRLLLERGGRVRRRWRLMRTGHVRVGKGLVGLQVGLVGEWTCLPCSVVPVPGISSVHPERRQLRRRRLLAAGHVSG